MRSASGTKGMGSGWLSLSSRYFRLWVLRAHTVMSIQQPARARAATDTPAPSTTSEVANTATARRPGERILRAEGASSIFGGNAVEDEEAEQGRDGAGRKTQHERARDEQRERRQKAQPQDSQGHAGERQDVPGAETQLVGERRVAERASEHAGGHGRQHVAEQLGAVRGSEVHRQDEALKEPMTMTTPKLMSMDERRIVKGRRPPSPFAPARP